MSVALLDLPEELLSNVLIFLPWKDLVATHQTCRAFSRISKESLIWRKYCLDDYRYWQGEGYLTSLKKAPPASVNWKRLFANRKEQDRALDHDFQSILDSQANRVNTMHHTLLGRYDSKDNLLRQMSVGDEVEDVLARRYWSTEIMGSIERSEALGEWIKLAMGEHVTLERAMGSFELFVAAKPPIALEDISLHLDTIATAFQLDPHNEQTETLTGFDRARRLSAWLHGMKYTGLDDEGTFRELRNVLLGIVLCEKNHACIPIISVAIFCCVAQRLGINAHPCPFPGKMLAVVNDDGVYPDSSQGDFSIYLDPHDGRTEISIARLKSQLAMWGIPPTEHEEFLRPATTIAMVKRVARNIQESLRERPEYAIAVAEADPDALRLQDRQNLATSLLPTRASYAVAWIDLLFPNGDQPNMLDIRIPLTRVFRHIEHNHKQDVFLLHQLLPLHGKALSSSSINDIVEGILEEDGTAPLVQRRSELSAEDQGKVKYHVGQVMKHRRYGYMGAITGWDTECRAGTHWISQMNVDALDRGRHQPFYHVIVSGDESARYVAEENIDVEAHGLDEPPEGLSMIAGQYFKRWDHESKCYISNVRDAYPED